MVERINGLLEKNLDLLKKAGDANDSEAFQSYSIALRELIMVKTILEKN